MPIRFSKLNFQNQWLICLSHPLTLFPVPLLSAPLSGAECQVLDSVLNGQLIPHPIPLHPLVSPSQKATKWSERKEAVAELTSLSDAPRIVPGDYFEVYRVLKKLITDVNIAVATEAIQAVGNLARGLRRDYAVGSRMLLATMLDRLKEKKPTVASALKETLQRGYVGGGTTLVDALEGEEGEPKDS